MSRQSTRFLTPALVAALAFLSLAGCGKSPAPAASNAPADAAAASQATQTAAPAADAASADAERAAVLAAKEKALADREAAVRQQELQAEIARRDAESAQQAAAAAKKSPSKVTPAKAAPAAVAATQPQPVAPPPPPPPPIVVPAGTALAIELVSAVTTKTAVVGDRVQGRLASDLVVGGRLAAAAGSSVSGSVTKVVSGSKKIGGTPTLGITFNSLAAGGGGPVAISARFMQQAASDTGKDTAKVVGTTAAGAIIGHQVSHKNGAVVGGILGGAGGLAIAQNTGGEVALAAGTVVSAPLDGAVQFEGS